MKNICSDIKLTVAVQGDCITSPTHNNVDVRETEDETLFKIMNTKYIVLIQLPQTCFKFKRVHIRKIGRKRAAFVMSVYIKLFTLSMSVWMLKLFN